ncbi:MAG: hypothetical protein ACFFKA_08620 [Candidatus Thorarchaeota archaeon]
MIFNGFQSNEMHHMMEWGPEFWYFLVVVGIVSFFIIIFVVLTMIRKEPKNLEHIESSTKNIETEEENINFCPVCGHEIRKINQN